MTFTILIFHNPYAAKGKSQKGLQKISDALHAKGIEYRVVNTLLTFEENRAALAKAYEEFNPTAIWVSGGDGTLHLLINSLPENMWQLPVAVIPTGSGNDFIKNYLQDTSIEGCINTALSGTPTPTDVWQCNGRLFVHGVGIGFDGKVVEGMVKGKSILSGFLLYYFFVLKFLFTYKEKEFVMQVDGKETRFPCFMVTMANSTTFGGGFKITPKALITDGLLDVCAIGGVPVLARPRYLTIVEKGKHLDLKYVNYFNTKTITLQLPHEMPGHIDGELFYGNRFEIGAYSEKLKVIM